MHAPAVLTCSVLSWQGGRDRFQRVPWWVGAHTTNCYPDWNGRVSTVEAEAASTFNRML